MLLFFSSFLLFFATDESTRVQLISTRGIEGSDYINASYIDVSTTNNLSGFPVSP